MGDATTPTDALQALERFVVDNDELLELEARIGRFNIFDALGIVRTEIRHSNFLAWLLDPAESHGQGAVFLKAVLMDLLKRAGEEGLPRALSPVELDGVELQGVEVRREWRSIDLLITCRDPSFVVAIENKVDSAEHSDQLQRYERIVRDQFPDQRKQFVYLTREGEEASDEDWVPYSYADIHRVLKRCRDANQTSIGDDVLAFLDHYLNLIGTRFMDDPTIDELCQRIYKNHRQAIDLIVARLGSLQSGVARDIREAIEQSDHRWTFLPAGAGWINLVPTCWAEWHRVTRPIEKIEHHALRAWFDCRGRYCKAAIEAGPLIDNDLRRAIIDRLTRTPDEFGFKIGRRRITNTWTRLTSDTLATWRDDEPDTDRLREAALKWLDEWHARLARVPDALRPIIAEWEAKRAKGVE